MKILKLIPFALLSSLFAGQLFSAPDEYVKLAGKVVVTKESDMWLKATVPFVTVAHPKAQTYLKKRPTTIQEVMNVEFLDNLKVKLYLCFSNEHQKKTLRSSTLTDAQFYQYYSAEVEYLTVQVDRNTKNAHFLFPALLAERDGFFKGGYVKLVGYAVEISQNDVPFEISESIFFDKYRTEEILNKFKAQAAANSDKNRGLLMPAHLVDSSYLDATTVVKPKADAGR